MPKTMTKQYYHVDDPATIYNGQAEVAKALGTNQTSVSTMVRDGIVVRLIDYRYIVRL